MKTVATRLPSGEIEGEKYFNPTKQEKEFIEKLAGIKVTGETVEKTR